MNPARELKKIAAELEKMQKQADSSINESIMILDTLNGKPITIPAENITRIDSEGVEYLDLDGTKVSASWNLMFIAEAMGLMSEDEEAEIYSQFTSLPEGEYDWSFIRDAEPDEKQDIIDYIKDQPIFNKMKKLNLTSITKV